MSTVKKLIRLSKQSKAGLSYKKFKIFNVLIKSSKLSANSSSCAFLFTLGLIPRQLAAALYCYE